MRLGCSSSGQVRMALTKESKVYYDSERFLQLHLFILRHILIFIFHHIYSCKFCTCLYMFLDISPMQLCSSLPPLPQVFRRIRCIGMDVLHEDDNLFGFVQGKSIYYQLRETFIFVIKTFEMYILELPLQPIFFHLIQ